MELAGRIALVTGGGSGIGHAVADRLGREGAAVVTWDLVGDVDVTVDVAEPLAINAAMADTVRQFGTPTVVVAAAGVGHAAALLDLSVEDWDRVMNVNARGVFLTYRAAARAMIDAGLGGSIVGVSSVNGVLTDPSLAAYSVSKAAVHHLTKIAAVEWGGHGIRVNAVGPGPTDTPMLAPHMDPEFRELTNAMTPLGRVGTAEDIAEVILNVVRSDWLTGQCVLADGGASLMSARGARRRL
jgi:NAD(P)-dependent dehydrogenase (short-subunit alcohol dehydrogenase family)